MLTVQAVEPVPRNGSRSPSTRFDVVRLEAAIESAVCRAWRQEIAGREKGDTYVGSIDTRIVKPAERAAQQASRANERPTVTSNVSGTQDVCQEAVDKVLTTVEQRAKADYEAVLGTSRLVAREMDHLQQRIALAQSRLAEAEGEARKREEADQAAIEETTARVREALALYVDAGVISAEEIETHIEGALTHVRERLSVQGRQACVRRDALQAELAELGARQAEIDSRRSALEVRQTQLQALPYIVALEQARAEGEARRAVSQREIIRFLETAPWDELSWQKQFTPEMERAVALAAASPTVFDALVERLGRELEQLDPARPGLGWSVLRAIESLELSRLFPAYEARRAELVLAARRNGRGGVGHPAVASKIVSLASRWGARVAGR